MFTESSVNAVAGNYGVVGGDYGISGGNYGAAAGSHDTATAGDASGDTSAAMQLLQLAHYHECSAAYFRQQWELCTHRAIEGMARAGDVSCTGSCG